MKKIVSVKELKEYCENHKPQQISFYTGNTGISGLYGTEREFLQNSLIKKPEFIMEIF